ncbi:hypothetical protein BKA62DRAFT_712265 [Auriculariales sp. MPI-PUGE-AT-0066]|nr:hypothetical protein BKA62DRAFT_712265 [Auriculariales sp. MPI-PUGE-AT-0066]
MAKTCAFWTPSYYNQPYDPEDQDIRAQVHQKLVPAHISPFQEPNNAARAALQNSPKWIELFFDLAWTMTFAGLNQGTAINSGKSVWSYVVFFVMVWFMWAQQVVYHTRYYADDAYHRFVLVIQFLLFGDIASYTSDFDISMGIQPYGPSAQDEGIERYQIRGFRVLSLIFFISRFLLMVQYIRVWRFSRQADWANPRFTAMRMWISTSGSAMLFLIAYIITQAIPVSRPANIVKFVLWALAISVESIAYIVTPVHRSISARLTTVPMGERLCTLTIIIVGEGLNSIINPIVGASMAVGSGVSTGAEIFAIGLIILLVYVLYVSSYATRPAPSSLRKRAVLGLHLPLQLSIILLIQGAKNILTIFAIQNSLNWLEKRGSELLVQARGGASQAQNVDRNVRDLYLHVGLNLTDIGNRITPLLNNVSDQTRSSELSVRLSALIYQKVFETFSILDDNNDLALTNYAYAPSGNDSDPFQDALYVGNTTDSSGNIRPPALYRLVNASSKTESSPLQWVAAVGGVYLILLAALMIVNGAPRIRWSWWQIMTRIVIGCILIIIDGAVVANNHTLTSWAYSGWYLPTLLIAFALVYIVDYEFAFLMWRDVRSHDNSTELDEKANNPKSGVPLPPNSTEQQERHSPRPSEEEGTIVVGRDNQDGWAKRRTSASANTPSSAQKLPPTPEDVPRTRGLFRSSYPQG